MVWASLLFSVLAPIFRRVIGSLRGYGLFRHRRDRRRLHSSSAYHRAVNAPDWRVLQGIQLSPRTGYILRRTGPDGLGQSRIGHTERRIEDTFDADDVVPAISEVIKIMDCLRSGTLEHALRNVALLVGNGPSKKLSGLVEMAAGPVHCSLHDRCSWTPRITSHFASTFDSIAVLICGGGSG